MKSVFQAMLLLAVSCTAIFTNAKAQATCGSPAFTVIISETQPISCHSSCNGALTANVTGGVGPFVYSWNNGPTTAVNTGLCAGTYILVVTDMGQGVACTAVYTLNQPQVLTSITSTQLPSCVTACDGTIVETHFGGTPPYTTVWLDPSNGVVLSTNAVLTNVCNGTYVFQVTDAHGCIDYDTVVVNQTTPCASYCGIHTVTTSNAAICTASNGTACVAVTSGGSGNFAYAWDAAAGAQTTQCASGLSSGTYCVTVYDITNACDTTVCVTVNTTSSPIVATGIPTQPTCIGLCNGTLNALASGGTPPYMYSMDTPGNMQSNNMFTGLCPGVHVLYAQDANGCMALYTFILTASGVDAVVSGIAPACNTSCDGILNATIVGGTAPYTTTWYNGTTPIGTGFTVTNVCNGVYVFCVTDANGCSDCDTVVFNTGTSCNTCTNLSLVTTAQPATCTASNGSACVSVTGGSGNYAYLWDATTNPQTTQCATGLASGQHCVNISDITNGCDTNICVTVGTTSANVIATAIPTNPTCAGTCDGTITAYATNGTMPYTYALDTPSGFTTNNVFTGVCAGVHIVYVQDANGCSAIYTVLVNAPAAINVVTTQNYPSSATACDGLAAGSANGGVSPYTYTWYDGGGNVISNQPTINNLCNGTYIFCATDANGCSNCDTVILNTGSGVHELNAPLFAVSPNPSDGELNIRVSHDFNPGRLDVMDALGRIVYSASVTPGQNLHLQTNWTAGMYLVKVWNENRTYTTRIIIR